MTNSRWLRPALMCGLLAASSAANAGFILSNPGAPSHTILPDNDFISELASHGVTSFQLGSSLQLTAPATLTFELWGSEAGYDNTLLAGGTTLLSTVGVAREVWGNVQQATYTFGAGTLDLTFCALSISKCLSNANNPSSDGLQSIGMWVDPAGTTAWLLWDDSGAGPDDNHDDMVVRVRISSATAVPEPSTVALLSLSLAGFGWFVLRQRQQRRRRSIELPLGQLSRRFR